MMQWNSIRRCLERCEGGYGLDLTDWSRPRLIAMGLVTDEAVPVLTDAGREWLANAGRGEK